MKRTLANKKGKSNKEISSIMCIDERMVESAMEMKKSKTSEDTTLLPMKEEEVQYIVYDCYSMQFYDSYVKAEDVQEKLMTEDISINTKTGKISFVKKFGDSQRINATILNCNRDMYPPDEKDIRDYVESRKKDPYDRKTAYQYENLYETHYAFLICTYFVPEKDPSQRIVLDPIYGKSLANSVKNNFLQIVKKENALNAEIQNQLDEMKIEIKSGSEVSASDYENVDKEFLRVVEEKYGKEEEDKYLSVKHLLISLEKAISNFTDGEYMSRDEKFKYESSKKLAIDVQNLIEHLFALIVFRHKDISRCESAKKVDHKSYEFYVKNMGFELDDKKTFLSKARMDTVKKILAKINNYDEIKQFPVHALIMVSILLTYEYDKNDTMYQLAQTVPQLLNTIEITLTERRYGKHDNDEKMEIFSVEEAKRRYLFASKIACTLLDIKADIRAEKVDVNKVKMDVDVLVNDVLKNYNISNEAVKIKAYETVKAFIEKDEDFFGKCYNCLSKIFYESMYSYLTQEVYEEILNGMPDDGETQISQINKIFELRGISDRIKTWTNKEKARSVDEFEKTNISALMYIYVTLADKYKPELMVKTKKDFMGLFDLAEFIKEKRGHNNKTDFNDKTVNFEEIQNKILYYSTKLTENENE